MAPKHEIVPSMKIPATVSDPETGREIAVTKEMVSTLNQLEFQFKSSIAFAAIALRDIRDHKLYLLRNCETFAEYSELHLGLSDRHARNYIAVADKFGDSKHYGEITQMPLATLLKLSRNDELVEQLKDGEVTLPNGERATVKELLTAENRQTVKELAEATQKIKKLNSDKKILEQTNLRNEKILEQYEADLGIRQEAIASKKECRQELAALVGYKDQILGVLTRIESEDIEIVRSVGALIGELKAGLALIEDKWIPLFAEKGVE